MAGRRPEETVRWPVVRQSWREMTFVHWRVDPTALDAHLPPTLALDRDRDGQAWVGLTLFAVEDFAIGRLPAPVPGGRRFAETNLRTYVRHRTTGVDGIWFLTLLAEHPILVAGGRAVGAPYRNADLAVTLAGGRVSYEHRPDGADTGYVVRIRPGSALVDGDRTDLDDFLTGRWRAYTVMAGRVAVVAVEHDPWPLRACEVEQVDAPLCRQWGIEPPEPTDVVAHYSPGVRARLGRPRFSG